MLSLGKSWDEMKYMTYMWWKWAILYLCFYYVTGHWINSHRRKYSYLKYMYLKWIGSLIHRTPPCHWPNRQKILLRWIIVMEAICGAATTFVFAASVQLPPSLSSSKELGQASGYWTRCPTEVCLMKSLSIITSTWMDTKVQVRLCYSLVTYCKTTETNEGGGSNVPKWFKWGGKQKNTCKFTIQTWTNKQCTSKGIHRYDASTQAAWTLELQCQIGWEEREMDQWKFFNEVQPDLPEIVWGCCDSGNPESFESPCGVEWHQRSCHCATSATAWSGLLVGAV